MPPIFSGDRSVVEESVGGFIRIHLMNHGTEDDVASQRNIKLVAEQKVRAPHNELADVGDHVQEEEGDPEAGRSSAPSL